MGIFDFLYRESADVEAYVKVKLDEAADWRNQEWEKLEARQQRIQNLNDRLLHLTIVANGDD